MLKATSLQKAQEFLKSFVINEARISSRLTSDYAPFY